MVFQRPRAFFWFAPPIDLPPRIRKQEQTRLIGGRRVGVRFGGVCLCRGDMRFGLSVGGMREALPAVLEARVHERREKRMRRQRL